MPSAILLGRLRSVRQWDSSAPSYCTRWYPISASSSSSHSWCIVSKAVLPATPPILQAGAQFSLRHRCERQYIWAATSQVTLVSTRGRGIWNDAARKHDEHDESGSCWLLPSPCTQAPAEMLMDIHVCDVPQVFPVTVYLCCWCGNSCVFRVDPPHQHCSALIPISLLATDVQEEVARSSSAVPRQKQI